MGRLQGVAENVPAGKLKIVGDLLIDLKAEGVHLCGGRGVESDQVVPRSGAGALWKIAEQGFAYRAGGQARVGNSSARGGEVGGVRYVEALGGE